MVIVVNHIISSAILYFQNPRRFHCQENAPDLAWQDDRLKQLSIHSEVPVSSGTHLQLFQDACLKFLEVGTVDELRSTIKDVLHLLFPDPLVCIVYLTDPGSGELYTEDGLRLSQFLPHQGICWEAINSRQGIIQTSIDPRDPVITAIKCHCDNTSTVPVSPVLSFPVVDITGDKVIALIVTSGGSTCIKDLDKLQPIGKQIVACFRRLCRTHSPVRQTSVNTEALVKLCGELYDHDASVLQLKVIKYLEEQTSAESSFLLLVVPDTQELFCQVVGDRVLAEELRFPGHNSSFATALETQQPIRLEDIPLDKRKGIEEFLEKKLQSFLCVPVTSRNSDSLIALVCVANKIGGDKFTEDDIFSIHQCFRYTAAVLTSTLAFQNERKLKIQTQAMLQVARNLFTRLGELLYKNSAFLDPFPLINSRGIQFNVAGMSFSDQLNSSPTVRCKNDPSVATSCNNNSSVEKYSFEKQLKQQEKIADLLTNKIPDKTNRYKCNSHFKSPSRIHTNHILHPPYKLPERTKEERGTANLSPKSLDTTVSSKDEVDFKKQLKINQKISDIIMSSTPIPPVAGQSRPIIDVVSPVTGQCRPIKDVVSPVAGQCRPIKDVVSPVAGQCSLGAVSPEISSAIGADQRTPDIRNVYQKSTAIPEIILESGSSGLEHTRDVVIQDEHHKTSSGNDYLSPIEGRNDDTVSFCGSCQSPLSFATALDYSSFSDDDDIDFSSSSQNSTFDADRSLESTAELDPLQKRSLSDIGLRDNETGANLVRISRSQPDIILTSLVSPSTVIESDVGIFTLESVRRSKEELCGVASEEVVKSEMRIIVEDSDTSLAHTISLSLIPNLYSGAYPSHKAKARLSSHSTEYIRGIQPPSTTFQDSYRNDLTKLLREVMQEARNLTHAERCSVFLIDNETEELVAKVFDGIPAEDNMIETEIRLPITQGIAGHVATTGQLLNIRDAYSHPMFYRGMDDSTGFRTRNILCFPLKDENGVVLGVAQLCNKKNGPCFTIFDEELALAFAVYCCISISHCLMYKKLQTSQQRNKLANELMIYHMQVCNEDVELLTKTEVTPTQVYDAEFAKFTYAPRSLPENDSLNASLSMFEDLGFISKYRIKLDTLARFLLMVKKGYRNPPYHNWMHAYTVSHFCFLLTKNLKLENYLEDIEIFALFVSCLCHDIDHRGTNNSFQVASKSVLAALYSSEGSVMERHHFAQTMCIVNTEGCNIFENLTSKDYQNVLDLIRDIILATDLAHHLRILKNIKEMAKAGYKKSVVRYRKLLLCLLMTSCDLSDQTKDWNNIKNIAGLIYQEFFSQGDVEKELGVEPIEMMDRERAQIPDLQISFLDHIATPLFSVLAEIFPEAKQVSDTVEDNRKHWLKVKELLLLRSHGSTSKMTLDEVLSVDEEISPEVFKNAPIQNGQ